MSSHILSLGQTCLFHPCFEYQPSGDFNCQKRTLAILYGVQHHHRPTSRPLTLELAVMQLLSST